VLIDVMHSREYSMEDLSALGKERGLKAYASFGHGLPSHLLPGFGKLGFRRLMSLGSLVPPLANSLGMIWLKPSR
jgi:hypothetical protein